MAIALPMLILTIDKVDDLVGKVLQVGKKKFIRLIK